MTTSTHTPGTTPTLFHPDPAAVRKAITKRSYAVLASTSAAGRPHSAGVLYALADDCLYVSTLRSSRKARNVAASPNVGVVIPVRRLPVGPPSSVQFQTTAEVLDLDDPHIATLATAGRLKAVTGHGELELPGGCLLRIHVPRRVLTYGLGMSLRRLLKDPLDAAGVTDLQPETMN